MHNSGIKKCCACNEDLPHDNFSKKADKKDGLNPRCKKCQSEYVREGRARRKRGEYRGKAWHAMTRRLLRSTMGGVNTCTKCGDIKPDADFVKQKACIGGISSICKLCDTPSRLARLRRFHMKHKARLNAESHARRRIWRKKNPEIHRARRRAEEARGRKILSDGYVKKVIKCRTRLRSTWIPRELVAAKRQQLLIHRELKRRQQ